MSEHHEILDTALLSRGWTRISDTSYEYATINQHTTLVIRNNKSLTMFYRTICTGGSVQIAETTPPIRAAREATRIAQQNDER
jgi:hypothetical protein